MQSSTHGRIYRCNLHLLVLLAAASLAALCDHAIDYWRLRICINKIKITDHKDYERLHWDYRPSVRDYSHVADPSVVTEPGFRVQILEFHDC